MDIKGWRRVFKKFKATDTDEYIKVKNHLDNYKPSYIPSLDLVFNAFKLCKFKNIKVIILGQDPYPNRANAMGLSFSVNPGVKIPQSLNNIFKEIERSLNIKNTTGDLTAWTKQGVLLLNTALSVIEGQSGSLMDNWFGFTNFIIGHISRKLKGVVFMLWGSKASIYKAIINNSPSHLILEAGHPSPLNLKKDFIGCDHFSKCNEYLIKTGRKAVNWSV